MESNAIKSNVNQQMWVEGVWVTSGWKLHVIHHFRFPPALVDSAKF